ncbi:hypothetical protein SNE40_015783 [Patella caerulea]|uniref:TIR domain-containing protein n=1 Tax=Patella caerulea TaxID=87958 RepID=A0AAN8JMW6_PATCE
MDQSQDLDQITIANHRMFRKNRITFNWKWNSFRVFLLLCLNLIFVYPYKFSSWFFVLKLDMVEAWATSDERVFNGGDIDMSCNWFSTDTKGCFWIKEPGIPIVEDDRHKVTTSSFLFWYHTSKLHISAIEKHDLGHYQCMCYNRHVPIRVETLRFAETETVWTDVPILGHLTFYLPGISPRESLDFYYTINDKLPVDKFNIFRCSWGLYPLIVWQQSTLSLTFDKIIEHSDKLSKMDICPSSDGYGTYKFFIRRQVFNKALNKTETQTSQYPTVFHVGIRYGLVGLDQYIPILSLVVFVLRAVANIFILLGFFAFSFIGTNLLAVRVLNIRAEKGFKKKLFDFCNIPNDILQVETDIHVTFKYRSGITRDIILLLILILNRHFKILGYLGAINYIGVLFDLIFSYSDTILLFKILLFKQVTTYTYYDRILDDNTRPGSLGGILPMDQYVKVYDIYLSYSDRDIVFVKDEILPVLQGRGLRVFLRHRDILPGRSVLTESENAICSSKAFLVVATDNYLKDYSRNHFELPLLKTVVNRSDIPDTNLLILISPTCALNEYMFDKYTIICITNDQFLHGEERGEIDLWIRTINDGYNVIARLTPDGIVSEPLTNSWSTIADRECGMHGTYSVILCPQDICIGPDVTVLH